MLAEKWFLRFAAICCFITVITTLGIHLYFPDPPLDFNKRLQLYKDFTYLLNRWWVILHCLCVIFSMYGFFLLRFKSNPGSTGMGFLFFVLFAVAEIYRQLFVLFFINGLREQYASTVDPVILQGLRHELQYAGLLTSPLFGLFIFSFGIGNIFYGISLFGERGFSKLVSVLLLAWGILTCFIFINQFTGYDQMNGFIEIFNFTFQPLVRLLLAIWLWRATINKS